jgi:uncharacterized heparinase superfamily protein
MMETIRHLQPTQVFYQGWYRVKNRRWKSYHYKALIHTSLHTLPAAPIQLVLSDGKYGGDRTFTFLNLTHAFGEQIDWNWVGYGKLWNYNLQYFDYLHDRQVKLESKVALVEDFCKRYLAKEIPPEPYPVSLRLMNWALFHTQTQYQSASFLQAFQEQTDYLRHNLEFHIQANHLLENYFALVIAGICLKQTDVLNQGIKGMLAQLDEQILPDGAHYECSPMYHQIILSRLLLVIGALKGQSTSHPCVTALEQHAANMLGWMLAFNYQDGTFAFVNDATEQIAPSAAVLLQEAAALHIKANPQTLKESGYRRWTRGDFEWMIDVGNILPTYQPGHAHSDMLQVLLKYKGVDVLVDTGISTYQTDQRRQAERRTLAHNTVTVADQDQSAVWGSFRVGKRAVVCIEQEVENKIRAYHNGYQKSHGVIHQRSFLCSDSGELTVQDELKGTQTQEGVARFHLDHQVGIQSQTSHQLVLSNGLTIDFVGHTSYQVATYQQALGYNKLVTAKVVVVPFVQSLETRIQST